MYRQSSSRLIQPAQLGSRRGFTVLELIVALTLGLVLLSAVWTMFRLFLRHQEIETAQVERTQIVSSLHHLLSHDLLNVIPEGREGPQGPAPPLPGSPSISPVETLNPLLLFPGGASDIPVAEMPLPASSSPQGVTFTLPTISLQGNQQRLELVVFAGADEALDSPAQPSNSTRRDPSSNERETPRLPSKVIVYEFVGLSEDLTSQTDEAQFNSAIADPDQDPAEAAIAAVGLRRRESLGEFPTSPSGNKQSTSANRGDRLATRSPNAALFPSADLTSTESVPSSQQQSSEEFAPEIIDLRFEYFDGRKWSSTWDSQRQKRLPVLVRVQLAIETRPKMRERKLKERLETGTDTTNEPLLEEPIDDEPSLTSAPSDLRPSPNLPGNDLVESPWDFEFLLFVTAPPATESAPAAINQGESPLPNRNSSGRAPAGPTTPSVAPRPRGGGLKP